MKRNVYNLQKVYLILIISLFSVMGLYAQEAYFVDGFHGGMWGHYPKSYTKYIVSLLDEHPDWRLNLEIEPDTWDRAMQVDPISYKRMQEFLNERPAEARVEYVNPTYAQSYFFIASGESAIRQFSYGIKKLRVHFPKIEFISYSSEEPCFTSALPQILTSFGIKYASLKNPNTLWGGYIRAYNGELVNWIGPDGTAIATVPRYEIEKLKPGSTWETIGNRNSPEYIKAAFNYGIENPVGMTLQDAGWKWGPWLKGEYYKPSIYTTWRNYFENVVDYKKITGWEFDQEDVLVSLVWGSEIMQKLAQQVRVAENNIIQAEKIASLHKIENGTAYPTASLDDAWQNLLLSQHHDCWIVPYNKSEGTSWAEKVVNWTSITNLVSNSVINTEKSGSGNFLKVYNTLGNKRSEFVEVELPKSFDPASTAVLDADGKYVQTQSSADGVGKIWFKADVPAYGYKVFELKKRENASKGGASVKKTSSGDYLLETDIYRIIIDGEKGSITSLKSKKLNNKEFIDQQAEQGFNILKGNFNKDGGWHTNTEKGATVEILERGPFRIKLAINTFLLDNPVKQTISLTAGATRIDFRLNIDWAKNVSIGEFKSADYEANNRRKPFYNDKYKLLCYFPLDLQKQRIFKNAPYAAMESGLENTFYDSWDNIKNNIILDWVDVTDGNQEYGMALFTDHTTTYAHGEDFPLALNVQYSGGGLWGRNHTIMGPTEIDYSLIPHKGSWEEAGIWQNNDRFNEPLKVVQITKEPSVKEKSFLVLDKKGWTLSSVYEENGSLLIRIFNAESDAEEGTINFQFDPGNVELVELNGEKKEKLKIESNGENYNVRLAMPQYGFRTLKLSGFNK